MSSIILGQDSYKFSQWVQYPPATTRVYSYIEARKGTETLMFGLQGLLKKHFLTPITKNDIDYAESRIIPHGLPFNRAGWEHILNKHGGYLPLSISAVPEGTRIPTSNILVSVYNTDPLSYWLTSYIETTLVRLWYPITVATISMQCKDIIKKFLEETADNLEGLPFKLHDFGFRGVSSEESAGIGGAAHLVNFMGSDTFEANEYLMKYYGATMASFSIPASEHSTITSWTREHEFEAYKNMLEQFGGKGKILACVSDSYNIFEAIKMWGKLKSRIQELETIVVVRPDCYDDKTEILTKTGWKLFKDLNKNEEVAAVNKDLNLQFEIPSKIIDQEYNGEMISFKDQKGRLDTVVTPNHRLVLLDNNILKINEASEQKFFYQRDMIQGATLKSNPDIRLSNYERFLIAFQADGSYQSKHSKTDNPGQETGKISLRFNFSKERKVNRLIDICKNAGLEYKVNIERSRPQNKQVYVWVNKESILGKYFTDWVNPFNKSIEWCQDFINEIKHWDATERSSGRIKYDSIIQSNSEIVQLIASLAGYGTVYTVYKDNRSDNFSDIHCVHIRPKSNRIGGQSIQKEVIQYNGRVYCVKVSTGMVLVRRNGKILISGNSGDPEIMSVQCVEALDQEFGHTVNSKGFKVLNNVRVIYGDGISYPSVIRTILANLKLRGYSADNIAFGMGGGLLQKCDRDTYSFAMKCSAIVEAKDKVVNVYKDPLGMSSKKSKQGFLDLIKTEAGYQTVNKSYYDSITVGSQLREVYRNGKLLIDESLETIRQRASRY